MQPVSRLTNGPRIRSDAREKVRVWEVTATLQDLSPSFLVDGNPVANVKLLQDANKLLMIMKDGQFHKEPQVATW